MLTPILAEIEGEAFMALLIPIVAVVGGLAIPIVAIITDYRRRKHLFELYHQERMAAIDKGLEMPALPEALLAHKPPQTPGSVLLRGLVWLFVGIGLYFALSNFMSKFSLAGMIPAGVGLAYLIYYFIEGRHRNPALERKSATEAAPPV